MSLHKAISVIIITICVILMFFSYEVKAQASITGTVLSEEETPLPAATVLLLNSSDSAMVRGTISSDSGLYQLENISPGSYLLSVSMIGYQSHITPSILVDDGREFINYEPFILRESIEQMDEVPVLARRPMFEQRIDRLVVNVQQSITAAGSSVLEVLEKSPGVQVSRQTNSISMSGKSGVQVMINDRPVNLPVDAVLQMLNGMSAANVEQIELITTPPARYEADGDAGIINIKISEYTDVGSTGTVGGNIGYNYAETLGGHVNYSSRGRSVAYFINYSINYDNNNSFWRSERFLDRGGITDFDKNEILRWHTTMVQNLRLGLEYSLTGNTTAGILLSGYRRNWAMDGIADFSSYQQPGYHQTSRMDVDESNIWWNTLANVSLDHSFSKNRFLRLNLDYLCYENNNPSFYESELIDGDRSLATSDGIDVGKNTPIEFWVGRLDYEHKISEYLTLESGAKGTWSHFLNKVRVLERIDGSWGLNNRYSNEADLTEKTGAIYLSGNWTPSDDYQINAGLRYEYTDSYLSTPDVGGAIYRKNGHLFPSLFILRKFTDTKSLGFSYTRRITRPTFNDMAPFVFFITPTTFLSGNPTLRPALSDGIQLNYQQNQALISLQYSFAKDEIGPWQSNIDTETNEQIFSAENLKFMRTYAATLTLPVKPARWWEIQTNITGRYQEFQSNHLEINRAGSASGFTFNMINTILLPQEFTLEVSGYYQTKFVMGLIEFRPRGALNAGVQKRMLDGRGTVRLSVNDIFYTDIGKWNGNNTQENVNFFTELDRHVRSVNMTFSWNFGNRNIDRVNVRSGSEEEQGRVNVN